MNKIKNLFALSLIAWFKVGASCGRTDAQCGGQVDNPRAHTCKNTVDCRLTRQHCDVSSGRCVSCIDSTQCPHGFRCNSARTQCVQCENDQECFRDESCASSGCVNGRCVGPTKNCFLFASHCIHGACKSCRFDKDCGSKKCNSAGDCVECLTKSDCSMEKPFCDNQMCVECSDNFHCQSNTNCDATCVQNVCQSGSLSCGTQICNVLSSTCVDCTSNSDCNNGQRCDLSSYKCVDCLNDSDCSTTTNCGATCDLTNKSCVSAASVDCTLSNQVCHDATCVECVTDQHCPSTKPRCNNLKCLPCIESKDCLDFDHCGSKCENNQCSMSALGNCSGVGKVCSIDGSTCVDCRDDSHCATNSSHPVCSKSKGHCVECSLDIQCDPCSICGNNNVCTPLFCESRGKICFPSTLSGSTARCVECVQDSDCSGAGVCTAFNTCESKNCQFDNDCRTDPLCNAECHLDGFSFTKTCIVPFGEGNLNCTAAGTVCQKDFGTCSNDCKRDGCAPGFTCKREKYLSSTCVPLTTPKPTTCASDNDCSTFTATPFCHSKRSVCVECKEEKNCVGKEEFACPPSCSSQGICDRSSACSKCVLVNDQYVCQSNHSCYKDDDCGPFSVCSSSACHANAILIGSIVGGAVVGALLLLACLLVFLKKRQKTHGYQLVARSDNDRTSMIYQAPAY